MLSIKTKLMSFDKKVAGSTFGRVFQLDGSGHVSKASFCLRLLTLEDPTTKECKIHERSPGRTNDILHYGVYNSSQCKIPRLEGHRELTLQASILTESGGTCVCNEPAPSTCLGNPEYDLCLIGRSGREH